MLEDIVRLREEEDKELEASAPAGTKDIGGAIIAFTLTTILGLLPLSFGIGTGAEIQAALARVVIGGLAASTLVTLVFIPVIYVPMNIGLEKARAKWADFTSRKKIETAKA